MGAHTMAPQAPSATTTPVRIANRQSPWREGGKTNPTHPTSNDQTDRTNNRQKRNRWRFKLKRTRKGGFAERCFQKVGFQRRGRPAPLRNKSGAGGPNTPPLKTPTSQNTLFDTPLHKTPSCRVVEKGDRASSSQLHNVGRHSTVTWGALRGQKCLRELVFCTAGAHTRPRQAPSAKSATCNT